MKATGIVRRIDDLGRVVIPKEIRRTMRIREGDPLEIFTDNDGEVIFKKYSPIGELGDFAGEYSEVLYKTGGYPVGVHQVHDAAADVPRRDDGGLDQAEQFHPLHRLEFLLGAGVGVAFDKIRRLKKSGGYPLFPLCMGALP